MVAHVKIHDAGWLTSENMEVAAAVETHYGGVHVASGLHEQVEGDDVGTVTSLLQLLNVEKARAFWNDPEYQRVAPIRRKGSDSYVVIIDGADSQLRWLGVDQPRRR